MGFGADLLNLLFPPRCPFCGQLLTRPGICGPCGEELPWTDDKDGWITGPDGFRCAGPLRYDGAVRETVLRLKFHGADDAAEPLGILTAQCAAERFAGEFDAVTWVPISKKRRRIRGYDQSELLAVSACRVWGVKPQRLLAKRTDNPAQSGLADTAARRANVSGVYAAANGAAIAGRRVLLIDDVCTTGATLAEARRVLLDNGAESVICTVLALARRKPETKSKK